MKLELDKYGIQMPAFSKIGGILANELSVDEAAGRCALIGRGPRGGAVGLTLCPAPSACSCGGHQRGGGQRGGQRHGVGSEEPCSSAHRPAGGADGRLPGDTEAGQAEEGGASSLQGEL